MYKETEIIIADHKRLTAEMRQKLLSALNLCIDQMSAVGLKPGKIREVSVNFRAKRWGLCKMDRLMRVYDIEISHRLLAGTTPEKSLNETILHELCHTLRGGGGHTGAWKAAAALLNKTYGYNIKRVNSPEEKGIEETPKDKEYRYILQCEKCGQLFKRQKRSALVEHPGRYRCRCGGRIKLLQKH